MIKEIKVFTIVCDICGADLLKEDDEAGWDDKDYLMEIAKDNLWATLEDKHYCPDCHTKDDDDNIIIKPKL
jgi:hypothetical protein